MITVRKQQNKTDRLLYVFLFLFLIGSWLGIRLFDQLNGTDLALKHEQSKFLLSVWRAGRFHLLVAMASLSALGILLIPISVVLRGCVFASAVMCLQAQGIGEVLYYCALPAFLQLPTLFGLACVGIRSSAVICDGNVRKSGHKQDTGLWQGIIRSAVAILLCAAVECWILPKLIHWI